MTRPAPPSEYADLDRRWARGAAIALILTALCPLALDGALDVTYHFAPALLTDAPPPHRHLILIPGLLGPALLLATLTLRGLPRALTLLLGAGLGITLLTAAAAQLDPPLDWGEGGLPPAHTLALYALTLTLATTGLGLIRAAPGHHIGVRLAGLAGALLIALNVTPLRGRTPLGLALDPISWHAAWPLPLTLTLGAAFALLCLALLTEYWATPSLAHLTRLIGLATVLALPLGALALTLTRYPALVPSIATMLIKTYGTWIALHALLAAGLLGLLQNTVVTRHR